MPHTKASENKSKSEKIKQAAREHEADEDEERWEKRLKKIAEGDAEKSD